MTEQNTCSNCDGLGKTIFSIHFKTGEKEYKSCEVCNGCGVICGSEKAYYSKYPDVSLRNAQELIRFNIISNDGPIEKVRIVPKITGKINS